MKTRLVACAVGVVLAIPTLLAPAWGAGSSTEGNDTAYSGNGSQYAAWSKSGKKLRLKVSPNSAMSTGKCMDAMLDWGNNGNHYDARVVRSCRPGKSEETDPGADGYWQEPSGTNPTHIQKGYGYMISDSTLTVLAEEPFNSVGGDDNYDVAPSTLSQGYARIRTRYQDNSVGTCNPLPVLSAFFGGCS